MKEFKLNIDSQIELDELIRYLKETEIEFEIVFNNDSVMPVFNQEAPYAIVKIDNEYKKLLEEIYLKVQEELSNKVEIENKGKKYNFKYLALLVYAVIITVTAAKYWAIVNRDDVLSDFKFVWNYNGTKLETIDKRTGRVISETHDVNFNANYEKTYIYSPNLKLRYVLNDLNDNGYLNEIFTYNDNKELTSIEYDFNNDGLFDQIEYYLKNGDTLIVVDKESNGNFEILK